MVAVRLVPAPRCRAGFFVLGHRSVGLSALLRPKQSVEFYRTLAAMVMGGLLFYFGSGLKWRWNGGAGLSAKA